MLNNVIGKSYGRYQITARLGDGGMASVFRAYDTRLDRSVAIKIIHPNQQSEHFLKRFEREARALARLNHPNIVQVIDYGDEDGIPYLVMVYQPGGTLKDVIGKPMPFQQAARLLTPIARALGYAHRNNLIHRDVKPSNILLTESGEPMLSDFGIAKILEDQNATNLTGTGLGIGTPNYMAPELWEGRVLPQSDIYALGVVLYEMITGHAPFAGDTPPAVMLKHITGEFPDPLTFVPDLPEEVCTIISTALAKSAQNRFSTMDDFARSLEALISLPGESTVSVSTKQSDPQAATRTAITPPEAQPARTPTPQPIPSAATEGATIDSIVTPSPPVTKKRLSPYLWIGGAVIALIIVAAVIILGSVSFLGNRVATRQAAALAEAATSTTTRTVPMAENQGTATQPQSSATIQSTPTFTDTPILPTATEDTLYLTETAIAIVFDFSPHTRAEDEVFTHWSAEDPPVVLETCARCHSSKGFLDYIGADGSPAGSVEVPPDNTEPTILTCETCHNEAAEDLNEVTFPSGVLISGRGRQTVCMICHMGRSSNLNIEELFEGASENEIRESGVFNIHYLAAAASRYGAETMSGAQYDGKEYAVISAHVEGYQACIECHDPHNLEIDVEGCAECHPDVRKPDDLHFVRLSPEDYDRDGNTTEGIYYEIEGVKIMLYDTIQSYASQIIGQPLVYDYNAFPYFFYDTNNSGTADGEESIRDNSYILWDIHLMKAAYNYQFAVKEPGAYVHNAPYMLQLLCDSLEDLGKYVQTRNNCYRP